MSEKQRLANNEKARRYRERHKNEPEYKARKRLYDHKFYDENKNRRIKYRGKLVYIEKSRKGKCEDCEKVKGLTTKQTQFHHLKYDDSNPALYTKELCAECHKAESNRLMGPEKRREIAKIARASLPIEACIRGGLN
jgi:hypothetical protein